LFVSRVQALLGGLLEVWFRFLDSPWRSAGLEGPVCHGGEGLIWGSFSLVDFGAWAANVGSDCGDACFGRGQADGRLAESGKIRCALADMNLRHPYPQRRDRKRPRALSKKCCLCMAGRLTRLGWHHFTRHPTKASRACQRGQLASSPAKNRQGQEHGKLASLAGGGGVP